MSAIVSSKWKASLALGAVGIVVLSLVGLLDIMVFAPHRYEKKRQARREAPPKIIRPSLRAEEDPVRPELTAFSKEAWRLADLPVVSTDDPTGWAGNAEDTYLEGFLAFQEGEKLLEEGQTEAAQREFESAKVAFSAIREKAPDFEPGMVKFRSQKIEEQLANTRRLLQEDPEITTER